MTVGRVIDHEINNDTHASVLGRSDQRHEVAERSESRVNPIEVGNVVPVIAVGGGLEGHEPDAADPNPGQVVETLGQAAEVADSVAVPIKESLDIKAVDDRILPPQVAGARGRHEIASD